MQRGKIKIANLLKLEPGYIIIFFDNETKQQPDKTGCNQVGLFLSESKVLFCRRNKVLIMDLAKIDLSKAKIISPNDKELSIRVLTYFNANVDNYRLVRLGFHALSHWKEKIFDTPEIMPKFPQKVLSVEQHTNAWDNLMKKLQPADLVFTFNEKSIISKSIAKMDQGSWSHAAVYVGNGEIVEAITQGVVKRPITVYKHKHVHIGVYKFVNDTIDRRKSILTNVSLMAGLKYNYKGAFLLGLRMLIGIDGDQQPPTPNGLIYSGEYYLIGYV